MTTIDKIQPYQIEGPVTIESWHVTVVPEKLKDGSSIGSLTRGLAPFDGSGFMHGSLLVGASKCDEG